MSDPFFTDPEGERALRTLRLNRLEHEQDLADEKREREYELKLIIYLEKELEKTS